MKVVTWAAIVILAVVLAAGCSRHKPAVSPAQIPRSTHAETPAPAPEAKESETEQKPENVCELRAQYAPVHFDFDSALLNPAARDALASVADCLREHPGASVHIAGFTDERGTEEYNVALGEMRAEAVRDYLARMGVPADRLNTISYGETRPVDSASNEAAWAKNRRAEIGTSK